MYKLNFSGILELQDVPKGTDFAPTKSFYLYTIKRDRLVNTVRELHNKSLLNLLVCLRANVCCVCVCVCVYAHGLHFGDSCDAPMSEQRMVSS